jgi:hypothetical protein
MSNIKIGVYAPTDKYNMFAIRYEKDDLVTVEAILEHLRGPVAELWKAHEPTARPQEIWHDGNCFWMSSKYQNQHDGELVTQEKLSIGGWITWTNKGFVIFQNHKSFSYYYMAVG